MHVRERELADQSRTLVALPKDHDSVPNTHIRWLKDL